MEELSCGSFSADVGKTQCQRNCGLAKQRCSTRPPVSGVLATLGSSKVVCLLCQTLVVYFGLGKLICILGYML